MIRSAAMRLRNLRVWMLLGLALALVAVPAGAQKKDKDKNKNKPASQSSDPADDLKAAMHAPDSQLIDQSIGEALGYWQIGDAESLHKYYAEDVVTVSGGWEAPVVGWDNFLKSYKEQRAQVSGVRMDRSNTLIKVMGNTAWATYQFVYSARAQGKVAQFRGHTTLVLMKQGEKWLITLNHSSIVDSSMSDSAPAATSAPPASR